MQVVLAGFVLLILGAGPWSAVAQTAADALEQQRWRAFLPAVRASTDCFAREALKHEGLADALARDSLDPILAEISRTACNGPFRVLVTEQDRIYGPRTGWTFASGPNRTDLPRAVLARIKPELDRREVEARRRQLEEQARLEADHARREKERQSQIAALEKSRDLLRGRMYECTKGEVATLVSSSETADVLATAAMTICRRQVEHTIDAIVELVRVKDPTANTSGLRDDLRARIKEDVVATAVRARADDKKRQEAKAKPPAEPPRREARAPPANPSAQTKAVAECLTIARSAQEDTVAERQKRIEGMVQLCRPEIENVARFHFLDDPSVPLDEHRRKAIEAAIAEAGKLLGEGLSGMPDRFGIAPASATQSR